MYKNDEFIKEYFPSQNGKFAHLKHSPILIDDFVGEAISAHEGYGKRKARLVSDIINYIARYGYGKLPLPILVKAAECVLFHGLKINDVVDLYTKHAGDWGGSSTVYRFDAIMQTKVVKSVTKTPMTRATLNLCVYENELTEGDSYDVASIRISAVDENGNLLNYSNEPIKIQVEGPLEIIGPDSVSLRGGMCGVYLKTVGKTGEARVKISSSNLGEKTVIFSVR
jgi:beta-galactosidase